MFKQLFQMLSRQDLLTQALNDTYEMAEISFRQYKYVIRIIFDDLNKKVTPEEIEEVRKQDYVLNHFERSIRKKVFEHIAINDKEEQQLYTAFLLATIVNNFERIGDYSKNIAEIAEIKHMLKDEELNTKIRTYSTKILSIYKNTLDAFKKGDDEMAKKIIDSHFDIKNAVDQDLSELVSREPSATVNYVGYGLFMRYIKRVSSHLMNIATSVTNPIDKIGYYVGDEELKDDE
ncbi:MAG: PhoU domain-containing protein [Candidatus Delongbacteria bacterium]